MPISDGIGPVRSAPTLHTQLHNAFNWSFRVVNYSESLQIASWMGVDRQNKRDTYAQKRSSYALLYSYLFWYRVLLFMSLAQ